MGFRTKHLSQFTIYLQICTTQNSSITTKHMKKNYSFICSLQTKFRSIDLQQYNTPLTQTNTSELYTSQQSKDRVSNGA